MRFFNVLKTKSHIFDYRVVPLLVCTSITTFSFVFLSGCSGSHKAVNSYVDAVKLRELDQNEKAIEKLNTAVKSNKKFSLAYSLLGDIYRELEDYEKSAAAYEQAGKLNPWSFEDYFSLGRVYQIMKKFALAVIAYNKACQLQPNHLDAHVNAAKCYYEIEDYNNARLYAERAEQIDPSAQDVHKILGDVYESRKDYEQAISMYKRALEFDSNNPEVMTSLAVAYLKTSRNEPAEELLKSVINIQPNNNNAYQYLGYCYLRFRDRAVKEYKKAMETKGDNAKRIQSLKARADEALYMAIEHYNKAVAINENDWQAHKGLGVAYMLSAIDLNDDVLKAKAIEQWRKSLAIEPNQPRREMVLKLIRRYSKNAE